MIADEITIRLRGEHDFTQTIFALLMHARTHHPKFYLLAGFLLVGPHSGDSVAKLFGIFKFGINYPSAPSQGGLQLFWLTNHHHDFWHLIRRGCSCRHHLGCGFFVRQ